MTAVRDKRAQIPIKVALSGALALLMLPAAALPNVAEAENIETVRGSVTVNGVTWNYTAPKGYLRTNMNIVGCSGATSVSIPSKLVVNGETCNIRTYTLKGNTEVTSVTLPNSPTTSPASSGAFSGCTNLRSITIPEAVTSLNASMFNGCTSLENVSLPSSITAIPGSLFKNCASLKTVKLSEGLETIGISSFAGCSSLTSVNLPASITKIGDSAFKGCSDLRSTKLPNATLKLGERAFENCTSLESVDLAGREDVPASCFSGCTSLRSVSGAKSVVRFDRASFMKCSSLSSVDYNRDTIELVSSNAFSETGFSVSGTYLVKADDGDLAVPITHTESGTLSLEAAKAAFEETNRIRRANGLAELKMDTGIMEIAERRALEGSIIYEHHKADFMEDSTKMLSSIGGYGENLGVPSVSKGQSMTDLGLKAMDGWMNSSDHRSAILSKNYSHVGIAFYKADGTNGYTAVMVFTKQPVSGTSYTFPSASSKKYSVSLAVKSQLQNF